MQDCWWLAPVACVLCRGPGQALCPAFCWGRGGTAPLAPHSLAPHRQHMSKAAACAATSTLLAWTAYLYVHICLFIYALVSRWVLKCSGCSVCLEALKALCNPARCRASSAQTCFQGAPSRSAADAQQLHLPSLHRNVLLCVGERQPLSCMSGHMLPESSTFGRYCGLRHVPVSAGTAVTALAACGTFLHAATGRGRGGAETTEWDGCEVLHTCVCQAWVLRLHVVSAVCLALLRIEMAQASSSAPKVSTTL